MVKLKDVAASAGVSTATVSLVLNNKPGVNAKTREKVLQVSRTLGYTPNGIAQQLATRRSLTIGLIVTDIENPFFAAVTKYLDQFTKEAGYGLIFEISNDDLEREETSIRDLIGKMVEGLVIVPTLRRLRRDFSVFDRLRALGIPYVFLTSYYPGHDCNCVMTDLEQGSYLITKHLIGLGHRDIVLLAPYDTRVIPAALRIDGFRKALRDRGFAFREDMIVRCREPSFKEGYERMASFIRRRKPDAIMAINDILALGAKRAVSEAGYQVPQDIAVAGFDDVIFSSISEVPLTTVRQDVPEMCRLAIQDLMTLLTLKDPYKRRFLFRSMRPELIVRASTSGDGKPHSDKG